MSNFIIDPNTKKRYSIESNMFKKILKKYIRIYKTGSALSTIFSNKLNDIDQAYKNKFKEEEDNKKKLWNSLEKSIRNKDKELIKKKLSELIFNREYNDLSFDSEADELAKLKDLKIVFINDEKDLPGYYDNHKKTLTLNYYNDYKMRLYLFFKGLSYIRLLSIVAIHEMFHWLQYNSKCGKIIGDIQKTKNIIDLSRMDCWMENHATVMTRRLINYYNNKNNKLNKHEKFGLNILLPMQTKNKLSKQFFNECYLKENDNPKCELEQIKSFLPVRRKKPEFKIKFLNGAVIKSKKRNKLGITKKSNKSNYNPNDLDDPDL